MKTLILTHCYPPNGGSFIKHRAKLIDAQVLTMGRPLGLWNFVRFVNDAVGSARKYEIIEAHWLYPAGIAAMIASWITKTPYVVWSHGTDAMMAERSRTWGWVAGLVMNRAQQVYAVSRFVAGRLQCASRKYRTSRHSVTVKIQPMEVDKSIFYDRGESRAEVGFIVKKNTGRYFGLTIQTNGLVKLNFVGYQQSDIANIFNHLTAVVLASENEGYGLMLAEAAECGCKIIGVNEGGIPEVVAKYGGLLFDGTAEDLKAKIKIALTVEAGAVPQ